MNPPSFCLFKVPYAKNHPKPSETRQHQRRVKESRKAYGVTSKCDSMHSITKFSAYDSFQSNESFNGSDAHKSTPIKFKIVILHLEIEELVLVQHLA